MKKIKMTFTLSADVRKELKIYAAKTDRSISETIEQAIREFLAKDQSTAAS